MQLLGDEKNLAIKRENEHWAEVVSKQRECRRSKETLQRHQGELQHLNMKLGIAKNSFAIALAPVRQHHDMCERVYQAAVNRNKHRHNCYSMPEVVNACKERDEATRRYQNMQQEESTSCGAQSPEGAALQLADHVVNSKQNDIDSVEKQLKRAQTPPPPLIHALPKTQKDMLVVLFFVRSDVTGCMPMLHKLCCMAQLSLCAWPIDEELLCSAFKSPTIPYATWNDYYKQQTASTYGHDSSRSCTAATVEVGSDVHLFTDFEIPKKKHVRSSSPKACTVERSDRMTLFPT